MIGVPLDTWQRWNRRLARLKRSGQFIFSLANLAAGSAIALVGTWFTVPSTERILTHPNMILAAILSVVSLPLYYAARVKEQRNADSVETVLDEMDEVAQRYIDIAPPERRSFFGWVLSGRRRQ